MRTSPNTVLADNIPCLRICTVFGQARVIEVRG
jgi:hypothetical protein